MTRQDSCHGRSEYCLRNYDDFTFAESHNSFSTPEDGIIAGINHLTGLESQWNDGIRAFMLDPYHPSELQNDKEDIVFCHAIGVANAPPCLFGGRRLLLVEESKLADEQQFG